MRVAIILAWLASVALATAVTCGFIYGTGWVEVEKIWALAWGKMSFADVYAGFTLFGIWLVHRERSILKSAIWIVLIMTLGNVISCAYVAIALQQSHGDWDRFWLGRSRSNSPA